MVSIASPRAINSKSNYVHITNGNLSNFVDMQKDISRVYIHALRSCM